MIVPQQRLLFWTALIAVPFSVLGSTVPWSFRPSAAIIAVFLAAVVYDAFAAARSLRDVGAELPDIVRLSKDREGSIDIDITYPAGKYDTLTVGLALPRHIASPYEYMTARLSDGSERSRVSWQCVPSIRGKYPVDNCYLGGGSPFGFWGVRRTVPARSEIRVYPNLHPERRNLAALFLNRGVLGIHAQRQMGKGRDFEKLREYIPGDGYDDIHWKATAKRGRPITKVFQIERTQEVYLVIDSSRLSARIAPGSTSTILERYLTAALIMGLVAERQGDLFGLLTFSDRVHGFVRARNGKAHYSACRDVLYTMQPSVVTPDFDEVLTFIRLNLRRRALLVFLTNLDDPALADSFTGKLDLACRNHLVLVNMMVPPYVRPLFSDDGAAEPGDVYQNLAGHLSWQKINELEKTMRRRGVNLSLLENDTMCTQLVTQYISVKRRQVL